MERSSDSPSSSFFAKPSLEVRLSPENTADLDAYIGTCSGQKRIRRLLFIAHNCSDLAESAAVAALDEIKTNTLDYNRYEAVHKFLHSIQTSSHVVEFDDKWVNETRKNSKSQLEKLEVELKNYQNNLIRESVRLGYNEIGHHYYKMGDMDATLRSHTKSREFCTTSQHVLETSMAIINVALDIQSYSLARNYIVKAESALEAIQGVYAKEAKARERGTAVNMPGVTTSREITPKERELAATKERLVIAYGIAELGLKNYAKAAKLLLRVTGLAKSTDSGGHFVPTEEIVLCAVITALATLDRKQCRALLLESNDFRSLIEIHPHIRAMLLCFFESRFQPALETLHRYQSTYLLSPHLSQHVTTLFQMIHSRSIVQFFMPFSAISLVRMAQSFGYTPEQMEQETLKLIEDGQLKARVDSCSKNLEVYDPPQRPFIFENAIRNGNNSNSLTHDLLLRFNMITNGIILKEKQSASSSSPTATASNRRHKP